MNIKKTTILLLSIILASIFAIFVYGAVYSAENIQIDVAMTNLTNASQNLLLNATTGNNKSDNITFIFTNFSNGGHVFNITINDSSSANTNTTFNFTLNTSLNLTDGLYRLIVNVTEDDGTDVNTSFANSTIAILVDNVAPDVQALNNGFADRKNFTTADENITFNVTVANGTTATGINVSDIHSVIFNITNGSGTSFLRASNLNKSGTPTNDTLFNLTVTVAEMADGNHTMQLLANDTADNLNNSQNITFIVDTVGPNIINVTNESSINKLNQSDSTPEFVWEVNDSVSDKLSCDILIDDITNVTGFIVSNGTLTNFTITTAIADGNHNWTVSCNDSVNLNNVSIATNFTVDTVAPDVQSLVNGFADRKNFTTADENITFNVTVANGTTATGVNVSDIHSVIFNISNGSGTSFLRASNLNKSGTPTNDTLFNLSVTVAEMADGNHTMQLLANDTAGNLNNSQNITFLVDRNAPNIINVSNESGINKLNQSDSTPEFVWEVNDSVSDKLSCDLFLDGVTNVTGISATNGTVTNFTITTALPDGNHNWSVSCNDSVNLNNVSIATNFTVDTVAPDVQAVDNGFEDKKNFTTADENITFNVTVANGTTATGVNVSDIHSVIFNISNGSGTSFLRASNLNKSGTPTNDTLFNLSVTVAEMADGNHTVQILANDTAGNLNNSQNLTFIVDTTAPDFIDLIGPDEAQAIKQSSINFDFAINDTISEKMLCDIILDDEIKESVIVTNSSTETIQLSSIANGDHNWSVTCNDSVGLNNISTVRNFSVSVPAASSSSSSSGGGGSSLSVISKNAVAHDADSLKPGETKKLTVKKFDTVKFKSKGVSHKLTVKAVFTDQIKIEVRSTVKTATIFVQKSKALDLDDNGKNDFVVTLNSITGKEANMEIKLLDEGLPATSAPAAVTETEAEAVPLGEEEEAEPEPKEAPKPAPTPEVVEQQDYTLIIALVVAAIVIIGAVIYRKKTQ